MAGLITPPDAWKADFKRITGYDADAINIKTPEHADKYIRVMQSLQNTNVGGAAQADYDYGKSGTTNEAASPEK